MVNIILLKIFYLIFLINIAKINQSINDIKTNMIGRTATIKILNIAIEFPKAMNE